MRTSNPLLRTNSGLPRLSIIPIGRIPDNTIIKEFDARHHPDSFRFIHIIVFLRFIRRLVNKKPIVNKENLFLTSINSREAVLVAVWQEF